MTNNGKVVILNYIKLQTTSYYSGLLSEVCPSGNITQLRKLRSPTKVGPTHTEQSKKCIMYDVKSREV